MKFQFDLEALWITQTWQDSTFGRTWMKLEACNFTKSNTPPWMFFTSFKLYKWYQIVQCLICLTNKTYGFQSKKKKTILYENLTTLVPLGLNVKRTIWPSNYYIHVQDCLDKTVFRFKNVNTILNFHFFCITPTVSVSIGVIQSVHNAMRIGWLVFAWYGRCDRSGWIWAMFSGIITVVDVSAAVSLLFITTLPFRCYNHSLLVTVVIKFVNSVFSLLFKVIFAIFMTWH